MTTTVDTVTAHEVRALGDELAGVYREAFGAAPYNRGEPEVAEFAEWLPRHTERHGFRAVVARRGPRGTTEGFAYGFANTPDQWWHAEVAKQAPPRTVAQWLADSFRLVEIAVRPEAQGRGIGGLLHDRLLDRLPYRTAVLSTMAAETRASRLYRGRGWTVLLDDVRFPGVAVPYCVLGLRLEEGADVAT